MILTTVSTLFLVISLNQASAVHLCGLPHGKDVCHSAASPDCSPLVVRPQTLPKIEFTGGCKTEEKVIIRPPKPLPTLKLLGDLCSCKRTIVTPAHIPKPNCKFISESTQTGHASESHHSHHYNEYHHAGEESHQYSAPADPVSLSLAYSLQHKGPCVIHEDRLNFGFRTMPKEIKIEKKINRIPEENLFKLNGEIVELKPVQCSSGKTIDQEALEDLEEEQLMENEEIGEDVPVRKLSYSEIGFAPATIKSCKFTKVQHTGQVQTETHNEEVVKTCHDGFQGGKVIVQSIPKKEIYVHPSPGPAPCDSYEDDDLAPKTITYPAFQCSSSSSSHKSHSSSSSCGSSNIVFSKLE